MGSVPSGCGGLYPPQRPIDAGVCIADWRMPTGLHACAGPLGGGNVYHVQSVPAIPFAMARAVASNLLSNRALS